MPTGMRDEIVESRIWAGGAEIVSHVNWSHIARVRMALGTTGADIHRQYFGQPAENSRPTLRLERKSKSASPRAA